MPAGFDNVLEEDVYNGEMGHAAKHNAVNDQVNFITEQLLPLKGDSPTLAEGMADTFLSVKEAPLNPERYGAVLDGVTDDTEAWTDLFVAVAATGATIDTRGRQSLLDSPIVAPAGAGKFTLRGANLKASAVFPAARAMLEFTGVGDPARMDLAFERCHLDGSHRAGLIKTEDVLRQSITGLRGRGFAGKGIWIMGSGAHECQITDTDLAEYLYGEPGFQVSESAIAVQLDTPDNRITDMVIASAATGVKVNAQYNFIHGLHAYGCVDWGVHLTPNGQFTGISSLYLDACPMLIEDPWFTEIVNSKFLHATADTTFQFVTLKPSAAGQYLYGFKLKDSSFSNNNPATIKSIGVDTSAGSFSASNVRYCSVQDNSFNKVEFRATRVRTEAYATGATAFPFNLSGKLIPGLAALYAQASFQPDGGDTPAVVVKGVGTTTVTPTLSAPSNGVMYLEADCNNGDF